MKREIVINASTLEVRVGLLEDGVLTEFHLERNERQGLVGNLYKGKVTRVLPGMQAAFVDIGLEKAGFLHVSDFHTGVEGFGSASKRLMGTIGDRQGLGDFVKLDDWNEYTIIVRGGTFIHILNGQLMAVMIDDDPGSSNNQSGQIGIEIEAITKVFVRNIWLKKLN